MNWTGGVRRRLLPTHRREIEIRQKKFFERHAQNGRIGSSNSLSGSFKAVGGQEHGTEGCGTPGNESMKVCVEGRQQVTKTATPENQFFQLFQEHAGIPFQSQHWQKLRKDLRRSQQKRELSQNRRGCSAEVKNTDEQCSTISSKEKESQQLGTVSDVRNSSVSSGIRDISNRFFGTSSAKTRKPKIQDMTQKVKMSGYHTSSTKKDDSYGCNKFSVTKNHSTSSKENYHCDSELSSSSETTRHKTHPRLSLCRKLPTTYGPYSAFILQMELNALCKKYGKTDVPKIEGVPTPYISQEKPTFRPTVSRAKEENDGVEEVDLLKNDSLRKKEESTKLKTKKNIFKTRIGDHSKPKREPDHRPKKSHRRQREPSAQIQDSQTPNESFNVKTVHTSDRGVSDSESDLLTLYERTALSSVEDEVKPQESVNVNHNEKYVFHDHPENNRVKHTSEVSDMDEIQTLEHSSQRAKKPLKRRRLGLHKILYIYQDQTPPVFEGTSETHPQRVIYIKNNPNLVQRKDKTPYRENNITTPKWLHPLPHDTSLFSSSSKASSEFLGDSSRTPVFTTSEETSSALSATSSLSGGKSRNMEKFEYVSGKNKNINKCDTGKPEVKSVKTSAISNSDEEASLDQSIKMHSSMNKHTKPEALNIDKIQTSELSSQKEETLLKRGLELHEISYACQNQITPVVEGTDETHPHQVMHIKNNPNLFQHMNKPDYRERIGAPPKGLHPLNKDTSQYRTPFKTSCTFGNLSRIPVPTAPENNFSTISITSPPNFPPVKSHNIVFDHVPDNIKRSKMGGAEEPKEEGMKRPLHYDEVASLDQIAKMQSGQCTQNAVSPTLRQKAPLWRSTQWNSNVSSHSDNSNIEKHRVGRTTCVEPTYDTHNEQKIYDYLEKSEYVGSSYTERPQNKQWFKGPSEHLQGSDTKHGVYEKIEHDFVSWEEEADPGTRMYGYIRHMKTIHNPNECKSTGFEKCIKENEYSLVGSKENVYIRQKEEAYVNEKGDLYLRQMASRCAEPRSVIFKSQSPKSQTRHGIVGSEKSFIVFEDKSTNAKPLDDECFGFKEAGNAVQREHESFGSTERGHEEEKESCSEEKESCSGSTTCSTVTSGHGTSTKTCRGPLGHLLSGSNSQDLSSEGTSIGPSPPTLDKTFIDVMEMSGLQPAEDLRQEWWVTGDRHGYKVQPVFHYGTKSNADSLNIHCEPTADNVQVTRIQRLDL